MFLIRIIKEIKIVIIVEKIFEPLSGNTIRLYCTYKLHIREFNYNNCKVKRYKLKALTIKTIKRHIFHIYFYIRIYLCVEVFLNFKVIILFTWDKRVGGVGWHLYTESSYRVCRRQAGNESFENVQKKDSYKKIS